MATSVERRARDVAAAEESERAPPRAPPPPHPPEVATTSTAASASASSSARLRPSATTTRSVRSSAVAGGIASRRGGGGGGIRRASASAAAALLLILLSPTTDPRGTDRTRRSDPPRGIAPALAFSPPPPPPVVSAGVRFVRTASRLPAKGRGYRSTPPIAGAASSSSSSLSSSSSVSPSDSGKGRSRRRRRGAGGGRGGRGRAGGERVGGGGGGGMGGGGGAPPPGGGGGGSKPRLQTWRVFGVDVHPDLLGSDAVTPSETARVRGRRRGGGLGRGEDDDDDDDDAASEAAVPPPCRSYLSPPVIDALASRLRIGRDSYDCGRNKSGAASDSNPAQSSLPGELTDVRVVRRSLDARRKRRSGPGGADDNDGPRYTYVLDVDVSASAARRMRLKHRPGRTELMSAPTASGASPRLTTEAIGPPPGAIEGDDDDEKKRPLVIIVGAGPAGLFCALTLARTGRCIPLVLERGQPVESRGRDIGALVRRRRIDSESNFAYGEGGAGTWSDGKLTTRIGRNSDAVREVLESLVRYGAPEKILVDGSPHLGTDNLVRLLRNARDDLRRMGGEIRFGAKVTKFHIEDGAVRGVDVEYRPAEERVAGGRRRRRRTDAAMERVGSETIRGDAVVLAAGHSARDVYVGLHDAGVRLEPKGFAAGFRVEHPQALINRIQYGREWGLSVVTGRGRTDEANAEHFRSLADDDDDAGGGGGGGGGGVETSERRHGGRLPVASYRLATDGAYDGSSYRGAYTFCMCPGGQIVPSSTDPDEVCVNGMSFSGRDSTWANAALVVTIDPDDEVLGPYREEHGPLAGVAFQRDMERRASAMGGGNLTAPVQRLTDFVEGVPSTSAPPSSYRLGVRPGPCHEIYPPPITRALRDAVLNHFEPRMPGFLCHDALLHGVETRTSSPVRVARDADTGEAPGCRGLFPAGEGAGYAGGIVSAAVDGMAVAECVMGMFGGSEGGEGDGSGRRRRRKRGRSVGFEY